MSSLLVFLLVLSASGPKASSLPTLVSPQHPRATPACSIAGRFFAGATNLPGVAVTVTGESLRSLLATSSGLDGRYSVEVPGPGRYQLRGELSAFTPVVREVVVDSGCALRVDFAMTLESRSKPPVPSAGGVG